MFFIFVDAYSKWMQVFPMNTSTTSTTIEKLRMVFATHELPEKLVSDSGSNLASEELEQFLKMNGIKHVKTAPYHPASNGLADRAVEAFKEGMKKMKGGSIDEARFLFQYRITSQTTTRVAPAELLMDRKLVSRLDLLTPDVGRRVERKQTEQKQRHDYHAKEQLLNPGDLVYARNYGRGEKRVPGRTDERTGPASSTIELEDHRMTRRHQDQIFKRENNVEGDNGNPARRLEEQSGEQTVAEMDVQQTNEVESNAVAEKENRREKASHRYPTRERQRPDNYG